MDLAAICEVLAATQQADETLRKAAEQKLDEATENTPDQLVQALVSVLAAGGNVDQSLRQQAAVILRRRLYDVGEKLTDATEKGLQTQILLTIQNDPAMPVVRSSGELVISMVSVSTESMESVNQLWPALLPWVAQAASGGFESTSCRIVALHVLKGMIQTENCGSFGEDMLRDQAAHLKELLAKALSDAMPEVRAAGVQIIFSFIENCEPDLFKGLSEAMTAVVNVIQGLATSSKENELLEVLEALQSASDEEGDFFFANISSPSGDEVQLAVWPWFESLWKLLMEIVKAGPETFGKTEIQHSAMECIINISSGVASTGEKSVKAFLPLLEGIVEVNMLWLLQIEENVETWTAEGKKDDEDDDCDGDNVKLAEENFDTLASKFDEDDLMPIVHRVCTAATAQNDWKSLRARAMVYNQVLEHLEDDTEVDQCLDYIVRLLSNPHPRVKFSAWEAISQGAYDQSERFNEKYAADVMPAVLQGLQDDNFRVVNSAVEAFGQFVDDMDHEELEPHMKDLLTLLFKHIETGLSRKLQENCIDVIAEISEACDQDFVNYYGQVMPLIKQLIGNATSHEQRSLRGKAFHCASVIGSNSGKEVFSKDACEIMGVIVPMFAAGFAADSTLRESVHDAADNIIKCIGKEFKPFAPALLPTMFEVLKEAPKEIHQLLDDPNLDEDDIVLNELGSMGYKMDTTTAMDEVLELLITLAAQLEEEFCDFIPDTVKVLLPLLDHPLPTDVRLTLFKTWGQVAKCAHAGVQCGRLNQAILTEAATEFLKKTIGSLSSVNPADVNENAMVKCADMKALADGTCDVLEKCGVGVLDKEALVDVARVVGKLLAGIEYKGDAPSGKSKKKKKVQDMMAEEDDSDFALSDDGEDDDATPQSARFSLADVMFVLLRTNTEVFVQEVVPTLMGQLVPKFIKPDSSDGDQCLGFYIANGVSDVLGPRGVQYWNLFVNQALVAAAGKKAEVQRFAINVLGTASRQKEFATCLIVAVKAVYNHLEKHVTKYKRRRVKADQIHQNASALAMDAGIRALGFMCEHQEQQLGEHATRAWGMWLKSLPIKYDEPAAHEVHAQLLKLLASEHHIIVSQEGLPVALAALTDVYKNKKTSTKQLDKDIEFAFNKIGQEKLQVLCGGFKDAQKKKLKDMLKVKDTNGVAVEDQLIDVPVCVDTPPTNGGYPTAGHCA